MGMSLITLINYTQTLLLQADNFEAVERVGIEGSHRGLLSNKQVFEVIQNWLGVTPKAKKLHNKTSKVTDSISSKLIPTEEARSC